MFTGTISNIGPVLDPNIRTAKVRIEVQNPGLMRPGHVRDRHLPRPDRKRRARPSPPLQSCICTIATGSTCRVKDKQFRRVEVVGGDMLPGNMQEIISGIAPGQQVVANALEFQNTVEQ